MPQAAPSRATAPARKAISLDDYLKRRDGRGRMSNGLAISGVTYVLQYHLVNLYHGPGSAVHQPGKRDLSGTGPGAE